MLLYLLRHADAVANADSDSERDLTDKGRSQAEKVGRFCRRNEIVPAIILTSPYKRAEKTARIVAHELELTPVIAPFLASGMKPEEAIIKFKDYEQLGSAMLVGHEPDLSLLAAALLQFPEQNSIRLRKASLTMIELENTGATLHFCIPVKLI